MPKQPAAKHVPQPGKNRPLAASTRNLSESDRAVRAQHYYDAKQEYLKAVNARQGDKAKSILSQELFPILYARCTQWEDTKGDPDFYARTACDLMIRKAADLINFLGDDTTERLDEWIESCITFLVMEEALTASRESLATEGPPPPPSQPAPPANPPAAGGGDAADPTSSLNLPGLSSKASSPAGTPRQSAAAALHSTATALQSAAASSTGAVLVVSPAASAKAKTEAKAAPDSTERRISAASNNQPVTYEEMASEFRLLEPDVTEQELLHKWERMPPAQPPGPQPPAKAKSVTPAPPAPPGLPDTQIHYSVDWGVEMQNFPTGTKWWSAPGGRYMTADEIADLAGEALRAVFPLYAYVPEPDTQEKQQRLLSRRQLQHRQYRKLQPAANRRR